VKKKAGNLLGNLIAEMAFVFIKIDHQDQVKIV